MNKGENTGAEKTCRAVLENRKMLSLTGIENIVSFDEGFVSLDGGDCIVTVDGEGMQILKMDTESGEIAIGGRINGVIYSDKRRSAKGYGGFFRVGKRQ